MNIPLFVWKLTVKYYIHIFKFNTLRREKKNRKEKTKIVIGTLRFSNQLNIVVPNKIHHSRETLLKISVFRRKFPCAYLESYCMFHTRNVLKLLFSMAHCPTFSSIFTQSLHLFVRIGALHCGAVLFLVHLGNADRCYCRRLTVGILNKWSEP